MAEFWIQVGGKFIHIRYFAFTGLGANLGNLVGFKGKEENDKESG